MGRVQSATLHLLCERERAIQTFVPENYWSVWVTYGEGFKAFLPQQPLPPSESPIKKPEKGAEPESERVTSQERADQLVKIARTWFSPSLCRVK